MNTKKLDKAWPIFEEISKEKFDSHCVSIGYAIGGVLPMEKETREWQEQIQRLTSQPLGDHPDLSLSAEEYGKVLHKSLTSGLATKLNLERVLLPTGDFAERLKKLTATYFEYIGLVTVMNDWFETLFEELPAKGFDTNAFTDEELMALIDRSVGEQGDLYLLCLEDRGSWQIA